MPEWKVGDRIDNRYEIHQILKGGMGVVVVYCHVHIFQYLLQETFDNLSFVFQIALSWVVEYNLWRGQVGTVVEILAGGDAFEVEFSDRHGRTAVPAQKGIFTI